MEQSIGRYQVLEEIASGAQGTVYRAFDPEGGRIIALKVLHPTLSVDRNYTERFRREASLAASIDHRNVVEIFEVGTDGDRHFMALEFLPESLAGIIQSVGQLRIEGAARYGVQIADGLAAAHALGIVHRDVKPQNVLIGADGMVKVTDFGIARAESLSTMTATGVVMGTPHYMSPEQSRGERADARSDVYSLGCIVYQMLAGELPFRGDTPLAVIRQQIDEDPPRLRGLRRDLPRRLESVVERAMEKDPRRRYQSTAEMAQALRAAVPGLTGPARSAAPRARPAPVPAPQPPRPAPARAPTPAAQAPQRPSTTFMRAWATAWRRSNRRRWTWLGTLLSISIALTVAGVRLDGYGRLSEWIDSTGLFDGAVGSSRTALPAVALQPTATPLFPTPTAVLVEAVVAAGEPTQSGWSRSVPGGALPVAVATEGTDNLYVSSNDGVLYHLDGNDGNQRWSLELGGEVTASVTRDDGRLYVIVDDTVLTAIDPGGDGAPWTPTVLWRRSLDQSGWRLAIGPEGDLYTVSGTGIVDRRFTVDGSSLWRVDLGVLEVGAPPVVGADGTVYVASASPGDVQAIDRHGRVLWTRNTGPVAVSPALGSLYVATDDGVLFAFQENGKLRWRRDGLTSASAPPVIASDGALYLLGRKELFRFTQEGTLEFTARFDRPFHAGLVLTPDVTALVLLNDGTLMSVAPDGSATELMRDERFRWLSDAPGDLVYIGGEDGVSAHQVASTGGEPVRAAASTAVPQPTVAPAAVQQQAAQVIVPTAAPAPTATPAAQRAATPVVVEAMVEATAAVLATGEPRYGGALRLALTRDPFSNGLSPYPDLSGPKAQVNSLIFSRLFRKHHGSHEFEGDLAEAWEVSSDGRTWLIRLRGDARFHDGSPVRAGDVAQSIKAMVGSGGSAFSGLRGHLNDVEILDDLTVMVSLNEPFAPFLDVLSSPWAPIGTERFLSGAAQGSAERLIGSGPFRLAEYAPGEVIILERNHDYFRQPLPYVYQIDIRFILEKETQLASLLAGRLDFTGLLVAWGLEPGEQERFERSESAELYEGWAMAPSLYFDTQNPPFNDPGVRRAVSLAIDMSSWADIVNQGRGRLESPVPSWFFPEWSQPESVVQRVLPNDLEQARALLAEAGYGNGLDTVLYVVRGGSNTRGAELIADMVSRIGIRVKIVQEEGPPLRARLLSEEGYHGMFFGFPSGLTFDIDGFLATSFLPGGRGNWSRVADRRIEDLFRQQRFEQGPRKRKELVSELAIGHVLADQVYLVPMPSVRLVQAHSTRVQNVRYDPGLDLGAMLERVWIDESSPRPVAEAAPAATLVTGSPVSVLEFSDDFNRSTLGDAWVSSGSPNTVRVVDGRVEATEDGNFIELRRHFEGDFTIEFDVEKVGTTNHACWDFHVELTALGMKGSILFDTGDSDGIRLGDGDDCGVTHSLGSAGANWGRATLTYKDGYAKFSFKNGNGATLVTDEELVGRFGTTGVRIWLAGYPDGPRYIDNVRIVGTPAGAAATQVPVAVATATAQPAQTTPAPSYGGTLRLALGQDPFANGFSPYTNMRGNKAQVNSLIFSRLFRKDYGSSEFGPELAEAWDVSADGRTWHIRLRGDARFHDGSPVRAGDVAQSIKAMVGSGGSAFSGLRGHLNDVEIVDDLTVMVSLNEPFAPFLDVLSSPWAPIGTERFLSGAAQGSAERLIGSGPFSLAEYAPGEVIILERNHDYFRQPLPYVYQIEFVIVSERATRLAAFRAGRLDFAGVGTGEGLDGAEREEISQSENAVLFEGWALAPALFFDTQNAPFNDVRVRRAVALAIDRRQWDEDVNSGWGRLEFGVPSLYFPEWAQPEEVTKGVLADDPEQAWRLLAEAGYGDGLRTVLYIGGGQVPPGAEIISEMLSQIGIHLEIRGIHLEKRQEEAASLRERLLSGDGYHGLYYGGLSGVTLGIDGFLERNFLPGGLGNFSRVNDPVIEEIFRAQRFELDQEKRRAIVADLDWYSFEETYVVPLPSARRLQAHSARLQGFSFQPTLDLGAMLERVWIDESAPLPAIALAKEPAAGPAPVPPTPIPTPVPPTPTPSTENLAFMVDESGWVTQFGQTGTGATHPPQAGDFNNNAPVRGFLSFDITSIPSAAIVSSSALILPDPEILGEPFPAFGSVKFEAVWYGLSLTPNAYDTSGYLVLQNAFGQPSGRIGVTAGIREAISLGYERFQIRFAFAASTDQDGSADEYIIRQVDRAGGGPILEVVYDASAAANVTVTKTQDTNDGICDADCSLREAIAVAGRGDTVDIPPGTYTLTLGSQLNIGKDLTLTGAGPASTIIQAATQPGVASQRVFVFEADTSVTISGLTMRHGSITGFGGGIHNSGRLTLTNSIISDNIARDPSGGNGGGILNQIGATLAMNNSTVSANSATLAGGGIFSNGTLSITNSTVSDNTAGTSGGGIVNSGTVNLTNSTISGNAADNSGGGILSTGRLTLNNSPVSNNNVLDSGGGIFSSGSGAMTFIANSPILRNKARFGGGIEIRDGATLNLLDSTVSGNSVTESGGGIFLTEPGTTLQITRSTIDGNSARLGGGVFSDGQTVTLTNSTVSGNNALVGPGGIYNDRGGTLDVANSTISANVGGGIVSDGNVKFINSIIANAPLGADCGGGFTSLGHNLDSDGTCNLTDPTDLPKTDPLLGPLQNNGGPTFTRALLSGSPAIDAGDDSAAPATDQRGVPRPWGAASDIGAYENGAFSAAIPTAAHLGRDNPPELGRVIFSDGMSGSLPRLTAGDYENGILVLQAQGPHPESAYYDSVSLPAQFSVEAEIRLEGDGRLRGGLFGSGEEGYLVPIDLNDADVQFWPVGNDLSNVGVPSPRVFSFETLPVRADGWYHLQLISRGPEQWVYVNRELVGYSDNISGVERGRIGFHVSAWGNDQVVASFDNFVLRELVSAAPEPTATLVVSVLFNGEPFLNVTDLSSNAWVRDESTGQLPVQRPTITSGDDAILIISDIAPGKYGVSLGAVDADGNGWPLAGDFYASVSPVEVPAAGSVVTKDLHVQRVLHLISPVDNAGIVGKYMPTGAGSTVIAPGNVVFAWEPLPEASTYRVRLDEYRDAPSYELIRQIDGATISGSSWTVELPASIEDMHYEFSLEAFSGSGAHVGRLMIKYDGGHGWDFRFKVGS